jgi:hypothetical protein
MRAALPSVIGVGAGLCASRVVVLVRRQPAATATMKLTRECMEVCEVDM